MELKWYAIPPYKNEGWQIMNEKGELVATFEDKNECIKSVELYNNELKTEHYEQQEST